MTATCPTPSECPLTVTREIAPDSRGVNGRVARCKHGAVTIIHGWRDPSELVLREVPRERLVMFAFGGDDDEETP